LDIFIFGIFTLRECISTASTLPAMDVDDVHGRIQEAMPYIWPYRK
jgi:hypothetical protein